MLLLLNETQIKMAQILTWRAALKLENLGLTRKGRSVYSIVRKHFNFNGNKEVVLTQLDKFIDLYILPGRRFLDDENYTDIS